MERLKYLLGLLIVFSLSGPVFVGGTPGNSVDIYVDQNSTSAIENGTQANPYKTINAALIAAGDIGFQTKANVLVAPGEYVEGQIEITRPNLSLLGYLSDPLFDAEGYLVDFVYPTIIKGAGPAPVAFYPVVLVLADDVEIAQFEFRPSDGGDPIWFAVSYIGQVEGKHIRGALIRNNIANGNFITGGTFIAGFALHATSGTISGNRDETSRFLGGFVAPTPKEWDRAVVHVVNNYFANKNGSDQATGTCYFGSTFIVDDNLPSDTGLSAFDVGNKYVNNSFGVQLFVRSPNTGSPRGTDLTPQENNISLSVSVRDTHIEGGAPFHLMNRNPFAVDPADVDFGRVNMEVIWMGNTIVGTDPAKFEFTGLGNARLIIADPERQLSSNVEIVPSNLEGNLLIITGETLYDTR